MKYKLLFLTIFEIICTLSFAQQISISRIDQMPDKPSPYLMRDWKEVAKNYDNFVFDVSKSGTFLPLTKINTTSGINYSDIHNILMDTYVGQKNHGNVAEAINIIPAVVGATLVGIDKTNQFDINWVKNIKDFYNLKNGENVYLNGYSSSTGSDWWYEIMPNVFFYQLYALYPNVDPNFSTQFTTIADRELDVLFKLGAKVQPWTPPSMNYRAFNLITGVPNSSSVPEPESAGSIAWILYQAYIQTKNIKYLQGAELALDFLQTCSKNPSYEIQLPYGILTAARMNAVEGTNYNIDKMLNWTFTSGEGTLRGWGTIVGNWNGYDVSGLIGEANDKGNDYAFIMNGFQHAAALAPVVKYDKRYAIAIGKWILNLANASRLFYANGLPDANQHSSGNEWAKQYDANFCIPFESMKQNWSGISPYATGDAVQGGWASTNLSLYSGSYVGYLASLINKTNVEGILQIDLNKTDFRGENAYPTYLYYNPLSNSQSVKIDLPDGIYDLYDAISETILKTNVSGFTNFNINSKGARIIVVIPAGQSKQTIGRIRKIYGGGVIDYHFGYNFTNPLRIKSFSSDKSRVVNPEIVTFNCLIENNTGSTTYKWYQNGVEISGTTNGTFYWTAPLISGIYKIKCEVTSNYSKVISNEIEIIVAPPGEIAPKINGWSFSGNEPYPISSSINIEASIEPNTASYSWSCSAGELRDTNSLNPTWILPVNAGVYSVTLTASNLLGSVSTTRKILVKDLQTSLIDGKLLIYYPMNGDTKNAAQNAFHAISHNAIPTEDKLGNLNSAYSFANNNQYIYTPNDSGLNFTDKIAVSLWIKPDNFPNYEQFVISHGSYEERFKMSITPERKMRWTLKTSNGIEDVDDTIGLQSGVFIHYTGLYTGYSLELYRNGVLASYKPLEGSIGISTKDITIARKDESETNYNYLGTVDEIRIYDADLPVKFIEKLPQAWNLSEGENLIKSNCSILIYPNPFTSFFTFSIDSLDFFDIEIMTIDGQIIWLKKNVKSGDVVFPQNIPQGIFFLFIKKSNEVISVLKLIKK